MIIDFGLDYKRFVFNSVKYKSRPSYNGDGSRGPEMECYQWIPDEDSFGGRWVEAEYLLHGVEYNEQKCWYCHIDNIAIGDMVANCMVCKRELTTQ